MRKLRKVVRDREGWRAAVRGISKSQTRLSNSTTTTQALGNSVLGTGPCRGQSHSWLAWTGRAVGTGRRGGWGGQASESPARDHKDILGLLF